MKNVVVIFLIVTTLNVFSQSSVEAIAKNYNAQVPIDFGEISLTHVHYNRSFFSYSYKYDNLKEEWSQDAKIGAITLQGSEITTSINDLSEFITIRKSGRSIIFLYNDRRGDSIYGIVFSINNGNYELDIDKSFSISNIDLD